MSRKQTIILIACILAVLLITCCCCLLAGAGGGGWALYGFAQEQLGFIFSEQVPPAVPALYDQIAARADG